ncbi:metal ABC transporter substrate-binding protein [Ferrovibrio sp.]|uniref:metal ABC transporter substrate-binding protein n=1 Tax=Ferrovibrio sp. TaxID=1917215 RepID=UPI0025BE908F|nr:metal ABC transporter substrate-binding protein [Ferrovibrio sp.]MBX3455150.1 metal ABC transporter substrate-binding protein [Ferrovibrio sp.]
MRKCLLALLLTAMVAMPAAAQDKRKAIASFSILADIVRQVGGEHVEVATLVPAGGDGHVYQPSPADARAVAGADILISNGLNFETWLDRLVQASGFKGTRIVASEGIPPRRLKDDGHKHDHDHKPGQKHDHGAADIDPHVWHDLTRMRRYVANIAEGLAKADPQHAEEYRKRAAAYTAQLDALDIWAKAAFDAIPRAQRKAITQHDAFGYLADRYQIEFLAPQGMNTETEASAENVARLVRQIKRERVQALFFENIINPRLIEQIAKEAKVKVGGRLYSDSLSVPGSEAGSEADSFLKLFRVNVERLADAMRRES